VMNKAEVAGLPLEERLQAVAARRCRPMNAEARGRGGGADKGERETATTEAGDRPGRRNHLQYGASAPAADHRSERCTGRRFRGCGLRCSYRMWIENLTREGAGGRVRLRPRRCQPTALIDGRQLSKSAEPDAVGDGLATGWPGVEPLPSRC
jgi:hypothetical protein